MCFSYKDKCGVRGHIVHVLRHLKEELAWATNKRLRVISNIKQLTTEELKNKAVLRLTQYCMHCHVVLSNIF